MFVLFHSSNLLVQSWKRETTCSERWAKFSHMKWRRCCTQILCRQIWWESSNWNTYSIVIFWEYKWLLDFFFPGGATEVERNNWRSRWDDKKFGWLYSWIRNRYGNYGLCWLVCIVTGRAKGETAVRPLFFLHLEVAAVEEKGVDNKLSLKSLQEGNSEYHLTVLFFIFMYLSWIIYLIFTEMQKVTEALVNNERWVERINKYLFHV